MKLGTTPYTAHTLPIYRYLGQQALVVELKCGALAIHPGDDSEVLALDLCWD